MRLPSLALAAAALGLAAPQIAAAHTQLVSSSPAANATVAAPTRIELRFNEAVIGATARAEIAMTGMPGMASHAPMPITGFTAQMGKDRKSMTLQLRRGLTVGTYRVTWAAAGADTHRMSGNFTFTVR
ncbi:copper homeostasis periplasmic binding protein CopC [Sphingobium phenoxybenzoativorans]|jgi:methionine-rich copper-binding protein CopC|uniref:Copper homeostasis periplasmic binding protein CopC n=1 Tax=Sphingobium phenoxybenzoativorans TaxID=1592790 RepID=A0A975KA71_9SPHN|nr:MULTISPECIES: copper homeostasis periplasmic binding protein CopC [Sphingobium]QUT07658.1 copper homeostasis periplasmic binding protein CopC [Sphingobium phenoxybenzoativorans]